MTQKTGFNELKAIYEKYNKSVMDTPPPFANQNQLVLSNRFVVFVVD